MTTSSITWTEEVVEAAGSKVQLVKGGSGEPLLILHGELGHPGWLKFHESLAQNYTLYIPSLAGFGESEPQEWIMNMRDMGGWSHAVLEDLGLGPVNVVGFSLGGWLAAEMATMCAHQFKKMVLVGAAGVRPPSGEILDMFLVVAKEFITKGYLDPANTPEFQQVCPEEPTPEQVEAWEVAREEACRLSWRPYMHYMGLPDLLRRLRNLPTLILWGRQDAIVPLSAGELYHECIRGSRLTVLEDCGHHPEVEKSDEFVRRIRDFLSEA